DVTQGASPEGVVAALAPAVATLQATLPRSYHIAVGGTVEESAQSQASVFAVIPLMLFIIVTVLMMQLHSFSRLYPRPERRSDGADRDRRHTSHFPETARVRGHSRHSGAARDDRAQCGDPHRSDRKRACGRQADMGCGGRGRDVPL